MRKACLLGAAFVVLASTGCQVSRSVVRPSLIASPALAEQKPADIAVLPIEDLTADKRVERLLGFMRNEVNRMLVRRKYSPLAVQTVDAAYSSQLPLSESSIVSSRILAGVAGRCQEDATMAIQISKWDESSLLSDGLVRFSAEVNLFSTKTRKALWSGGLQGTVKSGGTKPAPIDPAARARSAAEQFVYELITRLPSRML